MIPSSECMAHSYAQVWKNSQHTFAHSIHLLVLCFEILKLFFKSMVMSSKLCNIDIFCCFHKNVVLVCRINDRRKNIILFFLIAVLPCVGVVGEMGKLTTWGWRLLPHSNFVSSWDKSTTLGFFCTPRTFGIGWSWESFAFPYDSKSNFCLVSFVQVLVYIFYHL